MQKFIVLFRGINVGGKNILPMKALVELLKQQGYEGVSSYIQSGNVVLKSLECPVENIKNIVFQHFGFSPDVFSFTHTVFSALTLKNPYNQYEGKYVHFYFCKHHIQLNQRKLDKYIAGSETFLVNENVFYLYAPDGIGRSKLVANIEACLEQSATGRNLNTINKLSSMLKNA